MRKGCYHCRLYGLFGLLVIMGCMCLAGCGGGSEGLAPDSDGNYTVDCMAECVVEEQDISYMIYLKVKTDGSGQIISVEDAGTEVPEGKDGVYMTAQELFAELEGKTCADLGDVDAVSGATCSSQAILAAVGNGLQEVDAAISGK